MSRPGRGLEELVEVLEKALSGSNELRVVSPYITKDRHTGQSREVDVAVLGKVGSADVFYIFECRDRNAKSDSQWIEQVATKRDSVGAQKAIVVSTSGFTRPAKSKALAHNIETRTLRSLSGGDLPELLSYAVTIEAPGLAPTEIVLYFAEVGETRVFETFEEAEVCSKRILHFQSATSLPNLIANGERIELPIYKIMSETIRGLPGTALTAGEGERLVVQFLVGEAGGYAILDESTQARLLIVDIYVAPEEHVIHASPTSGYVYEGEDGERARAFTYDFQLPTGSVRARRIIRSR